MKYSPKLKYNILVSESCGLARSLPYRLPCGFPAQIKSAPAGELRALAAERPMDGLILSSDELSIALDAAEHSYTAVLVVAKSETASLNESCARAGVMAEIRRREHYEKPSVKRKKKAEAARKRKY